MSLLQVLLSSKTLNIKLTLEFILTARHSMHSIACFKVVATD